MNSNSQPSKYNFSGPGALDGKASVGASSEFSTITDFITFWKDVNGLAVGMLVDDTTNSVSWQIYYDSEWKARIYDGTFFVRAIKEGVPPIVGNYFQGLGTTDGVTLVENDIVLCTSVTLPALNGIWVVHESEPWERHPIFDTSSDSLSGIKFIVSEGTVYKNSQWEFTTFGSLTPSVLAASYSQWVSSPPTFRTYTWLNFSLVGADHPLNTSITIGKHDYQSIIDCTSTEQEIEKYIYLFTPFKDYWVYKKDSVNLLRYKIDNEQYAISKTNDWFKLGLYKNPFNEDVDSLEDCLVIVSNRNRRILTPTALSADGKLSVDVPTGWRLIQIKGWVSSAGTDDAYVSIGSTDGGTDISAMESFNDDGTVLTIDTNEIAEGVDLEIWANELSPGYWNGNTVTFELTIIEE